MRNIRETRWNSCKKWNSIAHCTGSTDLSNEEKEKERVIQPLPWAKPCDIPVSFAFMGYGLLLRRGCAGVWPRWLDVVLWRVSLGILLGILLGIWLRSRDILLLLHVHWFQALLGQKRFPLERERLWR